MSIVVHRVTLQVKVSADPAEHDVSEWLIDPVLPDTPKRHWVKPIVGDQIEQKTQEAKDAADAEYLEEQKQSRITELREQYNDALESRYKIRTLIYAVLLLVNAMGSMNDEVIDYMNELAAWIVDGDVLVETAEGLVQDCETVEDIQAVSLTLTSWLAADPKVSTRAARKL